MSEAPWGPTGKTVYERTYQRTNADGTKETWKDTVARVVVGNLSLVYGDPSDWSQDVRDEAEELRTMMGQFKIIPAGRHLWASGVPGRQYLFNCHVAGWGMKFSDHFQFTFLRLMEGGGVGSNYSSVNLLRYGPVRHALKVHIVCDPSHPDYDKMRAAGLLSGEYSHEWTGAFPVEDSREGWAAALVGLLDTHFRTDVGHTDRVFDVSRVRAEGQPLRTFGGTASGPLPLARLLTNTSRILNQRFYAGWEPDEFTDPVVIPGVNPAYVSPLDAMEIDHEIGACVVAGGNRRSARMSMVKWNDPYVFEFIRCKSDPSKHWTTNISVEIDDEFIHLVTDVDPEVSGWAKRAHEVYEAIVEGMLNNGEPGIWNSSLSNEGEPNRVVCTNPCGEIALTPWENCNLGHVNMDAFHDDWNGAVRAHQLMARFLIRATYGDVNDSRQAAVLARQRRIGVGHFGVQGWLAKQGIKYSEAPDHEGIQFDLMLLRRVVRDTARNYAFELRIPEPVKVTTVAPTGSIAKLPGRTEGIHPVYARNFIRRVRFSTVDPEQLDQLAEYAAQGYNVEPDMYADNTMVVEFPTKESLVQEVEDLGLPPEIVESADEIPLERMLAFQRMYQEFYADNAVSFTVNFPEGSLTVGEVMNTLRPYLSHLKGTTLMPDGTRPQAPYERLSEAEWSRYLGQVEVSVADSVDEECSNGACPIR